MAPSDLTVEAFLALRNEFFSTGRRPRPFRLRDKRNTQDDPLDEHIVKLLSYSLKGIVCQKASGPLISPDIVLYREAECSTATKTTLRDDLTRIVAIEVKKLERSSNGQIARSSGLDYNTTPPCGVVRVYDALDRPLDIRGFYLFACEETVADQAELSALVLCDGNLLNEDFDLYLSITSQREKEVGLGTYGDGANRNRPMLIFTNPLGASELDHACTLITRADLSAESRLRLVYRIRRSLPGGGRREFGAYRVKEDVSAAWKVVTLEDPFPQPAGRASTTQPRGRFRLPIKLRG